MNRKTHRDSWLVALAVTTFVATRTVMAWAGKQRSAGSQVPPVKGGADDRQESPGSDSVLSLAWREFREMGEGQANCRRVPRLRPS